MTTYYILCSGRFYGPWKDEREAKAMLPKYRRFDRWAEVLRGPS